jgi:hypothetical protein
VTIHVKAGEIRDISWTLNAELGGTTVELHARHYVDGEADDLIVLDSSVEGSVVTHHLDGTLAEGLWLIEVEITNGGDVSKAPTQGYERLIVHPSLEG